MCARFSLLISHGNFLNKCLITIKIIFKIDLLWTLINFFIIINCGFSQTVVQVCVQKLHPHDLYLVDDCFRGSFAMN